MTARWLRRVMRFRRPDPEGERVRNPPGRSAGAVLFALMLLPGLAAAGPNGAALNLSAGSGGTHGFDFSALWGWSWQHSTGASWLATGYWEANIGGWRRNHANEGMPNVTEAGVTPIVRLLYVGDATPCYIDAGLGAQVLHGESSVASGTTTNVSVSPVVGVGVLFNSGWEVSYRLRHVSLGDIQGPDNGVVFQSLHVARWF